MKLVFGSAQFGFKYGVYQRKVKKKEFNIIEKILKKNSVNIFDTAHAYGKSENIIGKFKINKKVITKIKLPKKKPQNLKKWFDRKIYKTMKNLKTKKIYGLLIHDTSDLNYNNGELIDIIVNAKKENKISKIGISVYEPLEIKKTIKKLKIDIIQMPVNILDHRFVNANLLKKLKKLNIEIFARSCFLQGLLLGDSLKIINKKNNKNFMNYLNWCKKNNVNKLKACINFVKQIKNIDYLIVGFDNSLHLKEIIKVFFSRQISVPKTFMCNDRNIIDPRNWLE